MAKVFLTPNGFEVDLFDKNGLRETRELHNHSEKYAEDCAENYVLGLFSV